MNKTSPHIVCGVLMRLNGLLQQRQPLCVLLGTFTAQPDSKQALNCAFVMKLECFNSTCLAGSCIAWTNFIESTVVERTASVRPYKNILNDALS